MDPQPLIVPDLSTWIPGRDCMDTKDAATAEPHPAKERA